MTDLTIAVMEIFERYKILSSIRVSMRTISPALPRNFPRKVWRKAPSAPPGCLLLNSSKDLIETRSSKSDIPKMRIKIEMTSSHRKGDRGGTNALRAKTEKPKGTRIDERPSNCTRASAMCEPIKPHRLDTWEREVATLKEGSLGS
jgi:hypothetical protein